MKIVIDIDNEEYQWIKDYPSVYNTQYHEQIRNGKPYEEKLKKPQGEKINMRINNGNELELCDSAITIIYEKENVTQVKSGISLPVFGVEVIYHDGQYNEPITLADIQKKYPRVRMVISEYGLSGKIYRYGNHGEFWEQVGTTEGYA